MRLETKSEFGYRPGQSCGGLRVDAGQHMQHVTSGQESAPGTVSGVSDISKILNNFQAEVIEKFSGVFDGKKAMDSNFSRGSCLAAFYMHEN